MASRVSFPQRLTLIFPDSLPLYSLSGFPSRGVFLTHPTKLFFPHSDANKEGQHGVEDYEWGSKPILAARRLKVLVDNDPSREDVPAPRFNAESYAGAATELWAQKFCQKSFIPPKSGYQT